MGNCQRETQLVYYSGIHNSCRVGYRDMQARMFDFAGKLSDFATLANKATDFATLAVDFSTLAGKFSVFTALP